MTGEILEKLQQITPEEQRILSGEKTIEKEIYMEENSNVIDATKLLEAGKLIQVRTHTRFIHFPEHTHNYVEMIYMCSGSTHHVINGEDVILKQGELLILNQNAVQEIYPAGEGDVAVNFIILPEFFDYGLKMIETEENQLRDFIVDCLRGENHPCQSSPGATGQHSALSTASGCQISKNQPSDSSRSRCTSLRKSSARSMERWIRRLPELPRSIAAAVSIDATMG